MDAALMTAGTTNDNDDLAKVECAMIGGRYPELVTQVNRQTASIDPVALATIAQRSRS
jgi:hypothetical protein